LYGSTAITSQSVTPFQCGIGDAKIEFSANVPDSAIHLTAGIIGEAGSVLSRTRALLAPEKPVLRIFDKADPLAKLAAVR
jgi:hypothetical protein